MVHKSRDHLQTFSNNNNNSVPWQGWNGSARAQLISAQQQQLRHHLPLSGCGTSCPSPRSPSVPPPQIVSAIYFELNTKLQQQQQITLSLQSANFKPWAFNSPLFPSVPTPPICVNKSARRSPPPVYCVCKVVLLFASFASHCIPWPISVRTLGSCSYIWLDL